jgi:hypothetical protein
VNRCLQKEPFSRYESANAVAAALRGWMQTQGAGAGTEQIRKLVENVLSDRIRLKQNMLEQIEASAQAPVDPEILLPSASINLPDKQPLEPQPSAPTAPTPVTSAPAAPAPAPVPADMVLESPEEVEPVTLRQIDRPPPVPEKTAPPATDPAPPSSESAPGPDPSPEEKEDTPPPFDPSFKFRRSYLQLYDQYQPYILGGAGVLVLIILIVIFSGGDDADEELTNGKEEPITTKVEVVPKKMTEEEAEAELAKLAPPRKQAMSVLSIKTDPKGCLVLIDKVELEGKTPLRNVMVPSEMEHEVVARCKGFKDESRFITPKAGESMEIEFYPSTPAAGN